MSDNDTVNFTTAEGLTNFDGELDHHSRNHMGSWESTVVDDFDISYFSKTGHIVEDLFT